MTAQRVQRLSAFHTLDIWRSGTAQYTISKKTSKPLCWHPVELQTSVMLPRHPCTPLKLIDLSFLSCETSSWRCTFLYFGSTTSSHLRYHSFHAVATRTEKKTDTARIAVQIADFDIGYRVPILVGTSGPIIITRTKGRTRGDVEIALMPNNAHPHPKLEHAPT